MKIPKWLKDFWNANPMVNPPSFKQPIEIKPAPDPEEGFSCLVKGLAKSLREGGWTWKEEELNGNQIRHHTLNKMMGERIDTLNVKYRRTRSFGSYYDIDFCSYHFSDKEEAYIGKLADELYTMKEVYERQAENHRLYLIEMETNKKKQEYYVSLGCPEGEKTEK